MNDYCVNLTLDINCNKNTPTIDFAQFDKGRVFSVSITADGEPFSVDGCKATLKCVHSDQSSTSLDCTDGINNSTVTITIREDTFPVRGLTAAKLVFTDGERNYSTQIFLIDVDSSLDGNVRATEAYSVINKLIDQVLVLNESGLILVDNELKADSRNPVENRVISVIINNILTALSSIPIKLSDLADDVGYVKSEEVDAKLNKKVDKVKPTYENTFPVLSKDGELKPTDKEVPQEFESVALTDRSIVTTGGLMNAYNQGLFKDYIATFDNVRLTAEKLEGEINKVNTLLTAIYAKMDKMVRTDEPIGLCVDFENGTFTRLGVADGLSAGKDFDYYPMFGGRKRCNVADDGTITAFYGDENYADDGSNGQVMLYQPKFYYKVQPLKTEDNADGLGKHIRKANYYVCAKKEYGFKLHPLFIGADGEEFDYVLLSAYEGSYYDSVNEKYFTDGVDTDSTINSGDLLCSVANQKPISGATKKMTKANLETVANNRGTGWHLTTIKAEMANQLLMMIELGTLNTQTAIGMGVVGIPDRSGTQRASDTGSTASLGNATGRAAKTVNNQSGDIVEYTEENRTAVAYRGYENPWGNIWKQTQGVNFWGDSTMGGGQVYVCNDFSFSEYKNNGNYEAAGFSIANANGYISAFGYGSEEFDWLLMPSETAGNASLPVGDYCYVTSNLNGYRIALLGATAVGSTNAGGYCWHCSNGGGAAQAIFGGRLMYVPQSEESETVNTTALEKAKAFDIIAGNSVSGGDSDSVTLEKAQAYDIITGGNDNE